MNTIEITSAKNNYQTATINGKNYEFEFNQTDLAEAITCHYYLAELESKSDLTRMEATQYEMSEVIALEWLFEDVKLLIQDFIFLTPDNLIDHLISE